ncbi:Hypothetical Protein FCC1311_080012 [Hondaea fermentalgiana]|uniref:Uncharacterized protein n=1 Tax=Hondaea fermentalgiana TaxID=2315210 RepID=A0A2R5GLJ9_9STRA|nr:Hypothetical Protein FCC1311_080012 [Hondaea fermentalgiana]|eukprot:GBG31776.1 Hypothetical Protein FCC1311_080012 [Hondaea fermentalgiana]
MHPASPLRNCNFPDDGIGQPVESAHYTLRANPPPSYTSAQGPSLHWREPENNTCTYDPHGGIHVVTACTLNHVEEVLDMIGSLQSMWTSRRNPGPAHKDKLHLHIFLLSDDVPQDVIDTYLTAACDIEVTVQAFDYSWLGFKDHDLTETVYNRILGLTNSLWKPTAIHRVVKEVGPCQVVFWCDASVRFGPAFSKTRVWDSVALNNGLAITNEWPGYLYVFRETIPVITHPMTFKMLNRLTRGRVSANMHDYEGVPSYAASFQIWYTGNEVVMQIMEDWANCALVKECMAPEGASGFTGFGECKMDYEGHCQYAALAILAYEYVKLINEAGLGRGRTDGQRLLPDLKKRVNGKQLVSIEKSHRQRPPRFCNHAGFEIQLPRMSMEN